MRLVLDLKTEVKPQLFNLKPVGEYGYRLVLDVYPAHPVDPLMALLKHPAIRQSDAASTRHYEHAAIAGRRKTSSSPRRRHPPGATSRSARIPALPNLPELRARTLIVAIDAGHGGEDPGARGGKAPVKKILRWRSRAR